MVKKTVQELAAEISDPSEFAQQPRLARLDSALRCDICRDVYDAPVSISCGHCFCSLVGVCLMISCRFD
jgi:E3 ubiquitin-protein ligase RAD18